MVFLKRFRKRHDEYSFEGENENLAGEPDPEAQQAVRADPEEGLALNPEAQSLTCGEEVEDVNIPAVSPPPEKKGIKMIRTCQLFLVLVHRTFLFAAVLIGGTYAIRAIENHYRESISHMELKDAAEYCYTILTTIGYGREKTLPTSDWGKVFTIVYAIIGIPVAIFTVGAYGAFLKHCVLKLIIGLEHCCCSCWQGKKMNLKVLIILILLFIAEFFCFGVYVCWLEDNNQWNYLDSVYSWFLTMTTIGFKQHNPYPDHLDLLHALAYLVTSLFSIITLAAIFQTVQQMIDAVHNQDRSICAMLFCCYSNNKKDAYPMDKYNSNHSMRYAEYPHE